MKQTKKNIVFLLVLCMVVCMIPTMGVQAKTKKYKLNYTQKILYVNDTFNLYAKNCFEKHTYSTSNKKIATVSKKGVVKAKKAGKATITVKIGKQKLKCKITVKNIPTQKDINVKQYSRESYGDTFRYLVIKNNSKETIAVSTNSKAYDESGNLIGASTGECLCIGSGQTSYLVECYDRTTGIASYDTKYTVKLSFYSDVLANLECEESAMPDKLIITATNRNKHKAMFVEAKVFLFKDGQFVGCCTDYLVDSSTCAINPNESFTRQIDLYYDYDYMEIYYAGMG